jgi:polysaccharide pyruvyl transferase WcaK-like protein
VNRVQKRNVGLFGYYGRHNFGDDLMAAMFAKAVVDCGASCLVYGMSCDYGERYRVQTTDSVDKLIANSRVIVYGGGGALLPQPASHAFSQTIGRLVDECQRRSVPLACLSIGGNNLPLRAITPESRQRLAYYAAYMSLRNPQEASLLREVGLNAEFYHDVVWMTPLVFGRGQYAPRERRFNRIAVNLYPQHDFKDELDEVFASIADTSSTTNWFFVETHIFAPQYRQAYIPTVTCDRFQPYQFADVDDGLRFIPQCDLIITSRLHVGIVAMSLGIPCIALSPEPKTRSCFEQLGLSEYCWGMDEVVRLSDVDDREACRELASKFDELDVSALQQSAGNHLTRLKEIIAGTIR